MPTFGTRGCRRSGVGARSLERWRSERVGSREESEGRKALRAATERRQEREREALHVCTMRLRGIAASGGQRGVARGSRGQGLGTAALSNKLQEKICDRLTNQC